MSPPSGRQEWGIDTGQASMIGLILVFGFVVAGAVSVVVLGSSALGDSQDHLGEERTEKAMTQFDSKAALVALGNADIQQVSFGNDRASNYEVQNGTGWMEITIENQTSGTTTVLLNQSLGAVTYEGEENTIAYQGGGVWRTGEGNGAVVVSPPEFHFREGTLTLPVVNVTGAPSLGDRASIRHEQTIKKYPNATLDNENPLENHLVEVTVKSEYYQGWGQYFEERTDGEVEYDDANETVSVTLVSPINQGKVPAGVTSLSTSGSLTISGSSADPCVPGSGGPPADRPYADSYNSSGTTDDYCTQDSVGATGSLGNITYGDSIDISGGSGGSPIEGHLRSGGDVSVAPGSGSGQPFVDGNIYYTDSCNPDVPQCDFRSTGSVEEIDENLLPASPISWYLNDTVNNLESSNDNGDPGVPISSNTLTFTSGSATLTEGKYYLDTIDLSGGETLEIDTSSGNVTIAVRKYVNVANGDIQVTGDNVAKLYIDGEATTVGPTGNDVMVSINGGDVSVVQDNSTQLRVYGHPDFNVTIKDGNLTGAVYAPPGSTGTGKLILRNDGHLFGGAVIADTEIQTQGSLHYDKALKGKRIISDDAKVLSITYLHVSVNRIRVS